VSAVLAAAAAAGLRAKHKHTMANQTKYHSALSAMAAATIRARATYEVRCGLAPPVAYRSTRLRRAAQPPK
jgi:hypothetical protein